MMPDMETLKNIPVEIRNNIWKPKIIGITLICPYHNQYDKAEAD